MPPKRKVARGVEQARRADIEAREELMPQHTYHCADDAILFDAPVDVAEIVEVYISQNPLRRPREFRHLSDRDYAVARLLAFPSLPLLEAMYELYADLERRGYYSDGRTHRSEHLRDLVRFVKAVAPHIHCASDFRSLHLTIIKSGQAPSVQTWDADALCCQVNLLSQIVGSHAKDGEYEELVGLMDALDAIAEYADSDNRQKGRSK